MALLRGIELLALGRQQTVALAYEKRAYVDAKGAPVAVDDRTCYDCLNNWFALAADPIDFCPHCGHRAKPWPEFADAQAWSRDYNFVWLNRLGIAPFAVRRSDGAWLLALAHDGSMLEQTGRYVSVRPLQNS